MLGAGGDGTGVAALGGAVLSAGVVAGSAGCSGEDEPVKEPNQRLTRLPLLALASPVSEFAVVVHCPDAFAVRVGVSGGGADDAEDPCASGVTEVEKAATEAAPSGVPPPSAIS